MSEQMMNEAVAYMTWVKSAELCQNLGKHRLITDESLEGVPGIVFDDGSYIEIRGDEFGCITGREERVSRRLFDVLDFLWFTHARGNSNVL